MKKVWLIIAAIAIVSCKNETAVDYAIVSGKITNASSNEIRLFGLGRTLLKKITLAEDGSFLDTLKTTGNLLLTQGRVATPLYLNAGDQITVHFDVKDFKNTLTLAGKGAEISNYLVSKNNIARELTGPGTTLYVKEEADYKKTIYEIKSKQKALLTAASGIADSYKEKEKRNINYAYLAMIDKYQIYHGHFAKKNGFIPSDAFLSELKEISYDNVEDFNFSPDYKSLVANHYQKKAAVLLKNGTEDRTLAMFKVADSITNQTIKNSLLYDAIKFEITYTNNLEEIYTAFMAGSTNKENNEEITKSYNSLKALSKGNASPKFVDYENNAGGTTSLDDLKGKYVYVDVWATWCGPCKKEIPFLQKVEKQYHGKNIHFLSISIDKAKDHGKWKQMIKDKKLSGIQLFADNDWNSKFVKDYLIKGIPKFILIDPEGNIVTANAPRPSNKKLIALFDELKI